MGWDRNPLRWRIDRVEAVAMIATLVAFLLATPLIAIVGAQLSDAADGDAAPLTAMRSWGHSHV